MVSSGWPVVEMLFDGRIVPTGGVLSRLASLHGHLRGVLGVLDVEGRHLLRLVVFQSAGRPVPTTPDRLRRRERDRIPMPAAQRGLMGASATGDEARHLIAAAADDLRG